MADQNSLPPDLPAEAQMNTLLRGSVTTQAIAVAARLGVADLVAVAPDPPMSWRRKRKPMRVRCDVYFSSSPALAFLRRTRPGNIGKQIE